MNALLERLWNFYSTRLFVPWHTRMTDFVVVKLEIVQYTYIDNALSLKHFFTSKIIMLHIIFIYTQQKHGRLSDLNITGMPRGIHTVCSLRAEIQEWRTILPALWSGCTWSAGSVGSLCVRWHWPVSSLPMSPSSSAKQATRMKMDVKDAGSLYLILMIWASYSKMAETRLEQEHLMLN